jgi:uncharacterized protein YbaR (Trm112 family)
VTGNPTLDPALLELVRCPQCHGTLQVDGAAGAGDPADEGGLVCTACSLRYPVRGGVPVLLVDDAVPWEAEAVRS